MPNGVAEPGLCNKICILVNNAGMLALSDQLFRFVIMYKTTIDQWLVFRTIVEENGYSAAAKAMNGSQSTISYSMAKLQSQLGVELLKIEGKRCELTPVGHTLLHRAHLLLEQFDDLEQSASYLADGIEAQISLAVEYIFPKDVLFEAIRAFNIRFPHTQVQVEEQLRLLPSDDLEYDIGISVSENGLLPGPKLLEITLVPAAHKNYTVFDQPNKTFTLEELQQYKQVFYQSSLRTNLDTLTSIPCHSWSVRSVEAAIAAVKAQLCFGWLPLHCITQHLQSGELQLIPLNKTTPSTIPLYLIEKPNRQSGPAVSYLKETILECSRHFQYPQLQSKN